MFERIILKQIELNEAITPDWREKDWELAIIVETAEAIDSTPWKWWKAQKEVDIDNLKIEAIDLLHFIISLGLSKINPDAYESNAELAVLINELMTEEWEAAQDELGVNASGGHTDHLKLFLSCILDFDEPSADRFTGSVYWLFTLMMCLGMEHCDVSELYMTKNLLNEYRQLRGYKDPNANYPKVVNGIEDNVRFLMIVQELGYNNPALREKAFYYMDATSL